VAMYGSTCGVRAVVKHFSKEFGKDLKDNTVSEDEGEALPGLHRSLLDPTRCQLPVATSFTLLDRYLANTPRVVCVR